MLLSKKREGKRLECDCSEAAAVDLWLGDVTLVLQNYSSKCGLFVGDILMRAKVVSSSLIVLCLLSIAAIAEEPQAANPSDITAVFKTWDGISSMEAPRTMLSEEGYLRSLKAPKGTTFKSSLSSKSGSADSIAKAFMTEHSGAFGMKSSKGDLEVIGVKPGQEHNNVHLRQTYAGLPVLGSGVSVQVNAEGGIEFVMSDIMRNSAALDSSSFSGTPSVSAEDAVSAAIIGVAEANDYPEEDLTVNGNAIQMIYSPEVVGNEGDPLRVWRIVVDSEVSANISEAVFVDTETKDIVLNYSLICYAKIRTIYDSGNSPADPGILVRAEGSPLSEVVDANMAYDYYGDTYDFYFQEHGRDSIDDMGMVMSATVRFCAPGAPCPFANAFWNGSRMYFGEGWPVDDIVAHELTHGVTQWTSNLIYLNESGAMSESFSDIWGEFIDLWNSEWDVYGDDSETARWLIGEDLINYPPLRDMKDPTALGDPDRYNSPFFYNGPFDNGGVHWNSGIGNKLCYLLTDGDNFNSWLINGMGISKVADLFYEVQTNIFPNIGPDPNDPREEFARGFSPDYFDLGIAMVVAAENLGYSASEVLNVALACRAVEILPPGDVQLRNFRATPSQADPQSVILSWRNPVDPLFLGNITIIRRQDKFPENPDDGDLAYNGPGTSYGTGLFYEDTGLVTGQEYFYGIFADFTTGVIGGEGEGEGEEEEEEEEEKQQSEETSLPKQFAKAVPGIPRTNYLSEVFIPFNHFDPDNPHFMDLAFTQLTFTPMGLDHADAIDTEKSGHVNYESYHAQVEKDIYELPVLRRDPQDPDDYGSITITLSEDDVIPLSDYIPLRQDIPFFGGYVRPLYLASNGFISTAAFFAVNDEYNDTFPTYNIPSALKNIPTLVSYFEIPRISPLFADLSPATGGEVWAKSMDDRIVVTFEKVPELYNWTPNTFQVEIFYSGKIRFTYLELGVETAVCGLSDGNGIPLFPDPDRLPGNYVDFMYRFFKDGLSAIPDTNALRIEPIPVQMVVEGDEVRLLIETTSPDGIPVIGVLPGPLLPQIAPLDVSNINAAGSPMQFTDLGDGRAEFTWQTDNDLVAIGGVNTYSLYFTAELGDDTAMQYVLIHVSDIKRMPVAFDLTITPERPKVNENIKGTYEYMSPEPFFGGFDIPEGNSIIFWFRNNSLIPALTNHTEVPAVATSIGDMWYFSIEPADIFGSIGELVYSPTIRVRDEVEPDINIDGLLDAQDVQLVTNAALGIDISPYNGDVNGDGVINAVDIQIVINRVLGQI